MTLRGFYEKNEKKQNGVFEQKIPVISFEIFPPKGISDEERKEKFQKLLGHLELLKKYNPAFVSLTYGAGGSTQDNSFDMIKQIQNDLGLKVMPHFTCVGMKKSNIKTYLNEIENLGIGSILALRGDIPEGMNFKDFDFHFANELVEFIKAETDLSIGVAGYPEGHIECDDFFLDLNNLKRKVDSGADAIYTQMFFDNDKFFSFYELARKAGIEIPIIPGILPIKSFIQFEKMLSMARVTVPKALNAKIEKFKDNPDDMKKLGIEFASYQCRQLIDSEIPGLHFYTLNSSSAVGEILDNLSII